MYAEARRALRGSGLPQSAPSVAVLAGTAAWFHDYDAAVTSCIERRALREGRLIHDRRITASYRPLVYLATWLVIM
ncbi:hypothetical protein GUJ93_ZPchr0012g18858 [Zizania palustris]|uniref:Uncharacterized protein n=1 Tax=Zizania palustris TaxID=103762 RepID=A0A8J5WT95_ZIZPA|nr:hypothetical protein GUJ93_ZPchr0012g18858 [Zizania palustris]